MFRLAELFVEIGARTGGLEGVLAAVQARLVNMGGAGQKVAGVVHKLGTGFLALGSLGPAALAACAAATVGLVAGMTKCVIAAAHFNETMSKTEQVFGSSVGKIKAAADQMAGKFGVSRREFLDAASMYGLIAQGAGIAADKAAEMSENLAKVALDSASFFETGTLTEALEKIRAGLTGESEPLKAFGVLLMEENVKTKAYAMGLARAGAELTNQQKIMARYALIMERLAPAAGDLEKTQDSLSNQWKKLTGNVENLATSIGTALVPGYQLLLQVSNRVVEDIIWSFDRVKLAVKSAGALIGVADMPGALGADWMREMEKEAAVDERNARMARDIHEEERRAKAMKDRPHGFQGGLEEYAKKVQQGAFGKADVAEKTLKESEKHTKFLEDMTKMLEVTLKDGRKVKVKTSYKDAPWY